MSRRAALTVTASVTFALAAGELLVRLLLPPPGMWVIPAADYGVMIPDPERGYSYAPNIRRHIRTSDYEVDFATNNLGMRDDPIDRGPPPRRRILALGDSYTQGLGVEALEAWPKRLEASLAD